MNIGTVEWIKALDEGQKIKYFGGKTKAALFDAGLLNQEDYFKPLNNIDLSGIIIPDKTAMNHSIIGDYILPSKGRPGGRLKSGGHTNKVMAEMQKRGILYNIIRIDKNGVMFGNVPDHDQSYKRKGEGQTWFPITWTEHDIMSAGIATANKGNWVSSYAKEFKYKNINIRVLFENGRISTICPSNDQ